VNPFIAFLCQGNIHVTSLYGDIVTLTSTQFPIYSGGVEYIMQEEFNRTDGFWWDLPRPLNHDKNKDDVILHKILYFEIDESNVGIIPIGIGNDKVEMVRYPRAGNTY